MCMSTSQAFRVDNTFREDGIHVEALALATHPVRKYNAKRAVRKRGVCFKRSHPDPQNLNRIVLLNSNSLAVVSKLRATAHRSRNF